VQFEPIKPVLKAPGTKRLILKWDKLLSNVAFTVNLRRYKQCVFVRSAARRTALPAEFTDGLCFNVEQGKGQGLTFVHVRAQLEQLQNTFMR
jgi:hypothetical protein